MPKSNSNKILEHRLTALEESDKRIGDSLNRLENDITNIRENHLTKIYNKLEEIDKKIYQRPGWIITFLVGMTTALIVFIITAK